MSRVKVSAEVNAPPEVVWKVVADPRNLTRWDRHIIKVTGVPEDGLAPGTAYRTEIRFMGVTAVVDAEVLEIHPPRSSKIALHGFMDALVQTKVEPLAGGERSRLEHDIEYRMKGGPLGAIAAHALRITGGPGFVLKRGTLAQKRQAEGG